MDAYTPGRILAVCMAVILILIFLIPAVYPFGTFIGLDGTAGTPDHSWASTDPVSAVLYGLGDLFCHQSESRSLIVNGSQTAFCCRDISIFIGLTAGLIVSDRRIGILRMSDRRIPYAGAATIAVAFLEWGAEQLSSADMYVLRIITGVIAGFGLAVIVEYAVMRQYGEIMEKD